MRLRRQRLTLLCGSWARVIPSETKSSLFGDHTIEARVQTAAGVSAVESRTFAVDAIQGPAIRILPLRSHVAVGDNLEIYVVVEEVIGVLGGNILICALNATYQRSRRFQCAAQLFDNWQ